MEDPDDSANVGRPSLRNAPCGSFSDNYKRKPVFSDAEKFLLIEKYGEYKEILASRLSDSATCSKKSEIWNFITQEMSKLNPNVHRTSKEVRKKWDNLATTSRKEFADLRGGISRGQPLSALTFKILELTDEIVFNPQPIKAENESKSPFDPDNGLLPVHIENGIQIEPEEPCLDQANFSESCRNIGNDEISTPSYATMPRISSTAGCFDFAHEKRPVATVKSSPVCWSGRVPFVDPHRPCELGQTADDGGTTPGSSAAKRRCVAGDHESENCAENFEETFKRKKFALELERMQLENEKLRLEVKLASVKLEKERRLMMD